MDIKRDFERKVLTDLLEATKIIVMAETEFDWNEQTIEQSLEKLISTSKVKILNQVLIAPSCVSDSPPMIVNKDDLLYAFWREYVTK